MTIFYFIRHGLTHQNQLHLIQGRNDYPLSSTGAEEVLKIAKSYFHQGLSFDYLFSSPLSRAQASARIFKDVFKYPGKIYIDDEFIERNFGEAEGKTINDEVYEKIVNDGYQGMEKNLDIEKRMYDEVIKIGEKYPNKKILILSHSHAIKGLLCAIDPKRRFTDPLRNVSITTIGYNEGVLSIIGVNELPQDKEPKWKI